MLRRVPMRMLLGKLHGEGVGDGCKNDDPGGVQIDGYPKDFADAHSGLSRHVGSLREEGAANSLQGFMSLEFAAASWLLGSHYYNSPNSPKGQMIGRCCVCVATACLSYHKA